MSAFTPTAPILLKRCPWIDRHLLSNFPSMCLYQNFFSPKPFQYPRLTDSIGNRFSFPVRGAALHILRKRIETDKISEENMIFHHFVTWPRELWVSSKPSTLKTFLHPQDNSYKFLTVCTVCTIYGSERQTFQVSAKQHS